MSFELSYPALRFACTGLSKGNPYICAIWHFSKISNFEILEMPERQTNGTNNDRDILAILL
ncbi:MAG: hypothetical protein LBR08_07295, partial [Bacteroidales bacterium]|nr:hypothetical protein [Bacteroidales bacterium]